MTAPPLTGLQLADIRYRGNRPSQYTAATIRRDYASLLAELDAARAELADARNTALIEAAAIASTVLSPLGQLETLYALHDLLLAARTQPAT